MGLYCGPKCEEMMKNFEGGGSGGSGGADNEFIIKATIVDESGTCTTDKTFAEMEEAYLSGKVLKIVEEVTNTQTTPPTTYTLHYYLNEYIHTNYKVLSFVNILPGAVNFHFHNIMIMEGMAQKITCTMTGEFHA